MTQFFGGIGTNTWHIYNHMLHLDVWMLISWKNFIFWLTIEENVYEMIKWSGLMDLMWLITSKQSWLKIKIELFANPTEEGLQEEKMCILFLI